MRKIKIVILLFTFFLAGCEQHEKGASNHETKELKVDFEKFTLDNGLQVVLHIDRSDPVVAVALTTHVGSARELEGRTGFAHLFEHLLFLESENLGKGGLDQMSARIGGSGANGSTSRDRTNYFQTVPKDALEKMIWAESEKLGFFINTVTEEVLAKEKQVVKNEKRQGVDNQPYGHRQYVIGKHMYPKNHPYNWQVIGSLTDLQNATLQDVKDFYNRWYTPNNSTLTISGDFDTAQAMEWVHHYFDEIKRGEDVSPLKKRPATLTATKKLYYEDNFATQPQLTMAWPTVPIYDKDSYALGVLASYLSEGKKAPFNKVLVDDKQLTAEVAMRNFGAELSGEYYVVINGFQNVDLDSINSAVADAFNLFEKEGISQEDLNRIKAGQETRYYNGLSSVLGKGFQLAQYKIFAGDPGYINEDVKKILSVTTDDVNRVYDTYIKGQNYIATSFVPLGHSNLALEDSDLAEVVEEKIVEGAEERFDASIAATYEKTPSLIDRSEPPYGESPNIKVPEVWEDSLSSGLKVFGIENSEVPLVQFTMNIRGGLLLEKSDKIGVSNLLAELMTKGTKNQTTEELENAIESLGATIDVSAGDEAIIITGNTLAKNYEKTMALVKEILLEPRWDENELELVKQSVISQIQQERADPYTIASNEYAKLIYGEEHILANNNLGDEKSVAVISLDDLKEYYETNISPTVAKIHIVGDISKAAATSAVASLNDDWRIKDVTFPALPAPEALSRSNVYFYDIPDAKQSELRFGYPALSATNEDFYPLQVMNYRLGGGGFASQLTQQLREGKGYTYGIRSNFSGSTLPGSFTISSGVRSNITAQAAILIRDILADYGRNYTAEDLEVSKSFLIKSNARSFETFRSKLNMLYNISSLNYPKDYAKQQEEIVKNMTVEEIQKLAEQYLNPNKMIYFVAGDAKTQMKKLESLGFGNPILLNAESELKKD